jgi:hypothetical protein
MTKTKDFKMTRKIGSQLIILAAVLLLVASAAQATEPGEYLISTSALARLSLTPAVAEAHIASVPFSLLNASEAALESDASIELQHYRIPEATARAFSLIGNRKTVGDALFTTSLISLVALNVADYFSTRQALKCSGLCEGNPLMKPFVKNAALFAGVKLGITALDFLLLKKLYKRNKTTAWIVSTLANVAMTCVVANNISKIRQYR